MGVWVPRQAAAYLQHLCHVLLPACGCLLAAPWEAEKTAAELWSWCKQRTWTIQMGAMK
jgi:hypothetical protein